MARQKQAKYLKLLEKNKDGSYKKVILNNDGSRGRVKFKILGLPKEFVTPTLSIANINSHLELLAENIKRLEECGLDPITGKPAMFPFSPRQIRVITDSGYTLEKKIIQAFTESMTYREAYVARCRIYLRWTEQDAAEFLSDDVPGERKDRVKVSYPINKEQMSWIGFADKELSLITYEDIRAVFGQVDREWKHTNDSSQRLSQGTANKMQASIKQVFTWAKQSNQLTVNPFDTDLVSINENLTPKSSRGKKHYWCPIQQEFIYQAAAELDSRYLDTGGLDTQHGKCATFASYEFFFRFGMCTGARLEDLIAARWDEFDNAGKDYMSWSFVQRKHKSKRGFKDAVDVNPYTVTINDFHMYPELLTLLKTAYENRQTDYVFEKLDGSDGVARPTIVSNFKNIIENANENLIASGINERGVDMDKREKPIKEITGSPHKMRHTMISNQVSGSDGNWDAASKRAGHADVLITVTTYGDMMSDEVENAWEKSAIAVAKKSAAALDRIRRIRRGALRIVK